MPYLATLPDDWRLTYYAGTMLPPRVTLLVDPQLRRMALLTAKSPTSASLTLVTGSSVIACTQQRRLLHRHFWNYNNWGSHLDPAYHDFHKKRHQRIRAAFRDTIRRRNKWQIPTPWKGILGTRLASHWSKDFKKWSQLEEELKKSQDPTNEDDYELSAGEKRWKRQMEQMRKQVEVNPYRAVFGAPFEPFWSSSAWNDPNEAELRESDASRRKDTARRVGDQYGSPESQSNAKDAPPSTSPKSSHADRAPAEPKAANVDRTPSWKEKTMASYSLSYSSHEQPGRKPVVQAAAETWDSSTNEVRHFEYDPISNRMVLASANQVDPSGASALGHTVQPAAADTKSLDIPVKKFSPPDAQSSPRSMQHAETDPETAARIREAVRKLDGHSTKPMGLQTSFEAEKQACKDEKAVPLEKELSRSNSESEQFDDGFSKEPTGLQEAYAREREEVMAQERPSLSEELEQDHPKTSAPDDGFSHEPTGLQEAYGRERKEVMAQERPSLSEELEQDRSQPQTESKAVQKQGSKAEGQVHLKGVQTLYDENIEAQTPALGILKGTDKRSLAASALMQREIDQQKDAMKSYEALRGQERSTASPVGSRGEGDLCINAAKFANSDRWYKQDKSLRETTNIAYAGRSNGLADEVKKIAGDNGLLDVARFERLEQDIAALKNGEQSASINNRSDSEKRREQQAQGSLASTTHIPAIKWAEPPSYKILAYDPGSDTISTVTTTSRFSDNEQPMSVPRAMSQVYEPARFVSHFASLQKDGYQAIHASENLLIFRQIDTEPEVDESAPAPPNTAATGDTPAKAPQTPAPRPHTEPATGNFASPTGFVNHDPVFPLETPEKGEAAANEGTGEGEGEDAQRPGKRRLSVEDGIYYRHYPRVRRQEAVFSGSRTHHNHRHHDGTHPHSHSHRHRGRRPAWKRRVRFALSVGATSAAVVYALGVGSQLTRGELKSEPTA